MPDSIYSEHMTDDGIAFRFSSEPELHLKLWTAYQPGSNGPVFTGDTRFEAIGKLRKWLAKTETMVDN